MLSLFNSIITFISRRLVTPLRRRKRRAFVVAILLAGLVYLIYLGLFSPATLETETSTVASSTVTLMQVGQINSNSTFSAVGTVQAVSEAQLKAEAGGQVTAVYTDIGKSVRAGAILAQTENARESATLLQAQGSYEAALAGSAQGDSGVRDAQNGLLNAKNAAVTTYKSTYTSVSGSLFGTVDQFFSNPDNSTPGVRLSSGYTEFLNRERVALQKTFPAWKTKAVSLTAKDNLESALTEAEVNTKKVLAITDAFIDILNKETRSTQYSEEQLRALGSTFNGVRAGLVSNLAAIDGARSGLTAAAEAIKRADIAGSGSGVTLSGAQLKIALGSLRSAQAAYEKTLVRTPISGVVNALYIKQGDYVTPGADAALIANNRGLQVETAINQADRDLISIGEKVTINDTATGTITAIAGAVDPKTGKITVKISLADDAGLVNGTVAKITLQIAKATPTTPTQTEFSIPLTAVKLAASGPLVFTVNSESKLEAIAVVLGSVSGETVGVKSGLVFDQKIVLDARGHKPGESVTVITD